MKIAIDARWIFPEISGIGSYTRCLIRHLARMDSPHGFILLFDGEEQQERTFRDADIAGYGKFTPLIVRAGLFSLRNQWVLPGILSGCGADVYHSPNYMIPFRSFPRNRRGRIGCVVNIHDVIPMLFPGHAPKAKKSRMYFLYRRVMLEAAARADAIITGSDCSRRDIFEQLRIPPASQAKVHTVFNGVSERFRPPPADPASPPVPRRFGADRPARLLYVGRSDPYKNLAGLIRAMAIVRERSPFPVELQIAGPKDDRYPEAPLLAHELGLHDVVQWSGFLDDDSLLAAYQSADLLVQPSLYEGFGLPVVEAMACGTPVVCSNTGSLPEVAAVAARMIDPNDPNDLADGILQVLQDDELAEQLAFRGVERAAEFTWDRTARETIAVYETAGSLAPGERAGARE
ncbi:MAG: glycosyltransferase family 4 protein [Lentisphaerae bacterium]|nr:glycosyltransferase family 4 protein [Lentisphaerota bacterium]